MLKTKKYYSLFLSLICIACSSIEDDNSREAKHSGSKNVDDIRANDFSKNNLRFSVEYEPGKSSDGSLFIYKITGLKGSNPLIYNLNGDTEQRRINYLVNYFSKDVFLVENSTDTLLPDNTVYERTYGVAPFVKVLLFFQRNYSEDPADIQIVIDENIYGFGLTKYTFDKEFFRNYPI